MDPQSAPPYRERVDAFRRQHRTGLVTLLFTDIVGSTALKQQLGDRAGADLFLKHHQMVRATLRDFPQGEEIETAGDSFLIIFATPSDAVQFALLLQARLGKLNRESGAILQDRIGIHVGEVVIGADEQSQKPRDLFGIQIDTCSRVMSLAKAGQTLMTRSVFDSARQVLKGEDIEGLNQLNELNEEAPAKPSEGRVTRVPDLSQPQEKWGLVELVPPRESNQLSRGSQLEWLNHGPYLLKGLEEAVEICEVREAGQNTGGPPTTSEKAQRQARADEEPVLGWRPALDQNVPNTQWVLEKKLGEGGFGEVWLGRHQTMKERRVFKFCFRADRVRSLKREMTLFRVLKERVGDHPNIVRLLEVNFDEPPFYVVMDHVEGQDLKDWCEQQGGVEKVPLVARLEIVAQIADALQAAHDAGVIHRDVKPGNVLISDLRFAICDLPETNQKSEIRNQKLSAKLTDFGIGQVVSEEALKGMTKAGFTQTIVAESSSSQTGSQMYMAPELLAGKPASTRSDIYSLGVVLYQLLVSDFSRPLTTDWAADISDPLLRDDLQHCFSGNPQERFAGAGQLAKNLRALPDRQQALAKQQAELAARERAAYRRGLIRAFGLAAIVVALVSFLAITAWRQSSIARTVAHSLRENLYVADMSVAHRALLDFNFSRATELVDKYRAPQAGESELRGFEWRYLWQQTRGNHAKSFSDHSNSVSCVAFSPDGRLLATVGWDLRIQIRDLLSGQIITNLAGINEWIRRDALAFSPDGKTLAVCQGRRLRCYDTLTWQEVRNFEHHKKPWRGVPYNDPIAFSPDGRTLAETGDGRILFWDTLDWTQKKPPLTTNLPVFGILLAYSPDGKRLATASYEQVQLWDIETRRLLIASKKFSPASIAYSPDSRWLAVGDVGGGVWLWDATDLSKEPSRFAADSDMVWSLVFSGDSQKLFTGGVDHLVRVWDVATLRQVHQLQGQPSKIWSLALSQDGRWLAGGTDRGPVLIWDAHAMPENAGYNEALRPLGFLEDGTRLVALDTNRTFKHLDLATKRLVKSVTLPLDDKSTPPAAVSSDGKNVAFLISTNRVEIWHLEAATKRSTLTNRTTRFWNFMLFSPDNQLIAVGRDSSAQEAERRCVEVWDVSSGLTVATLMGLSAYGLAFSPDGRMLAGEALGFRTKVVNMATKTEFIFPSGQRQHTTAAAFSPNCKLLATASYDSDVRLWNVESGRAHRLLKGHKHEVHCVTFSPDGKTLVTGSFDGEVKFWSVATGKELLSVHIPGEKLEFAMFSPDARTLVLQDSRHIFRVPTLAEIDALGRAKSKGE